MITEISDIDINFKVETNIQKDDIRFYDSLNKPFKIYGLIYENDKFRRMPEKFAEAVSEGVYHLHTNTAGGRVRFKTNSSYVAIKADMENIGKMGHFALVGSAGFDLYVNNVYYGSFEPPYSIENGYESVVEIGNIGLVDITINFPLYSDVKKLYIGLENNAYIEESAPYKNKYPIVYYGSSITQGGCASRPGSCYPAAISRKFDLDYINLGFSGNAKAEDTIIEYIKDMDMSIFVYDYDHNAPDTDHLAKTHEKMFKAIRAENPELPIVIMSRPKAILAQEEIKRLEIINSTYNNALMNGDDNVYMLDGACLTSMCGNEGTVDGTHPTDFGFASMAAALSLVVSKIVAER